MSFIHPDAFELQSVGRLLVTRHQRNKSLASVYALSQVPLSLVFPFRQWHSRERVTTSPPKSNQCHLRPNGQVEVFLPPPHTPGNAGRHDKQGKRPNISSVKPLGMAIKRKMEKKTELGQSIGLAGKQSISWSFKVHLHIYLQKLLCTLARV